MKPRSIDLFAVCDPDGNINHTTVSTESKYCIEEFLHVESCCNWIANMGRAERGEQTRCLASWEGFEAEGYRVIPVVLSARTT